MNLCIITKDKEKDESARYLYEECKKKPFSKVLLTDLAKLTARISNSAIGVGQFKELNWDAYLLRPSSQDFPFTYLVASILEQKALVFPSSKAILSCTDRGLLAKTVFESKVLQPLTYMVYSASTAKKVAQRFKKFALKFPKHGGKGVTILERPSTTSELLDIFSHLVQPFCIQRFIKGEVIKALVIGEEIIGLKEIPQKKEERSNEGKRERVNLNQEVKADLIKLAKYLKAFLFEVDLIKRGRIYFVIDISLNPNLKIYTDLSGRNIGAIFANYILKNYSSTQYLLKI